MCIRDRYVNTVDLEERAWEERAQPCVNMINDIKPDIIGLQEPRAVQREDLIASLTDYVYFSPADLGVEDSQSGYVGIMYKKDRFKVLDKGGFWLSPTPDEASCPEWGATDTQIRMAIWLFLHDNEADKDFYICNTHLPYKSPDIAARTACVQLIIERMKEKAGRVYPIFITGDMNMSYATNDSRRTSLEGFYEWLWSARDEAENANPSVYSFNNFGDSTPAATWNIDHIFYRLVEPLTFTTITNGDYGVKYISDHYPILLEAKY